jgi:hypothetical protein
MHLQATTHEHPASGKVYTYDADYVVEADRIDWTAHASQGEENQVDLAGSIPLTSPGVAAVAEQAVRDAVLSEIDALDPA